MFFRRHPVHEPTFEERLQRLTEMGFHLERLPDGHVKASRNNCAARITAVPGQAPRFERAGWSFGDDIGVLVDAGFQKFWRVGNARRAPALAEQLKTLHQFEEDLREGLGLTSLYNTSLGTTNDLHLYDRVEGRDRGGARRPWQQPA